MEQVLKEYSIESEGVKLDVRVLYKAGDFVRMYELGLPEFGEGTKALMDNLRHSIILDPNIRAEKMLDAKEVENLRKVFRQKAEEVLRKDLPQLDERTKDSILMTLLVDMLGMGKIDILLLDGNLEEIVVNNAKEPVWVYHKEFGWLKTNVMMESEEQVQNYASIIARRGGKQITILNPLLDTHLITGDRANATLFPISGKGNTITIRRFRRDPWTVTDLINNRTTTSEVMALVWMAMEYELNIIFSGGTASGKCVSGDTKIIVSSQLKTIKEIVEKEMEKNRPIQTEDGFFATPADIEVLSFNPQNLGVEKSRISTVWKRKAPENLIRITTQSGKRIEVTPEHPFFVMNGVLEKKRADEIKAGDFVPTARKLEIGPTELKSLSCPKIENSVTIQKNGVWVKARASKKLVRVPQAMSCELARFTGYVLGDGHITKNRHTVRFSNTDNRLLEDFKKCGENIFGVVGKKIYPKNRCPYIEFNSKVIAEFLIQNFKIDAGKKSGSITIVPEILLGDKEHLEEIIRGLFECEASVHVKKGELEFSSASPLIIEDLSMALHRFGILHITKKMKTRNRLFIAGKNLQEFGKEIGFLRPDKNDAIFRSAKKTFSPNFDFVPNIKPVLASLKEVLGMHEKEMCGALSREAISRYLTRKRNPTRESLIEVATCLEKRFFELAAEKQKMSEMEERERQNKKILALAKDIYRRVNLTRKRLAEKAGISEVTMWLWETERVKPTPESLHEMGRVVVKEFEEYYERLQTPAPDLYSASKLGMTPSFLSWETGIHLTTTSKYFRENKMVESLLSKIRDWQKQKMEELNLVRQEALELKNIVEAERSFDTYKELKGIKQKLKMRANTPVLRSAKLIMQRLGEATSEETLQKIIWLKSLATSNILWDKTVKIEKVEPKEQWVYDLTVEGNHTFFANNVVAHNTSMLNACLPFIQPNHRIITIEDTRELSIPGFLHWVPMTTREPNAESKGGVTMLDLLVNSLRQRPDRIIVGETRRQREAEVMFEAMHTGHSVYTTFHANTADETIRRFTNPPIDIPESQLEAVHLNVVMFRNRRLGVRRVLELAEFVPERRGSTETLKANILYRWRTIGDVIAKDSESIRLMDELTMHTGLTYDEISKELAEKKSVLEWLVKNNVHNIHEVGKVMARYYLDRNSVVEAVRKKRKVSEL